MNEKLEEVRKCKIESDKLLLDTEIILMITSLVFFLVSILIGMFVEIEISYKILLIITATTLFVISCAFALRIEQIAGYYRCKCGHKYIPTYGSVFLAPHIGRTRLMKCPECGKSCWHKKVLDNVSEEE